jgi:predicted nucleic acid-binding protein
VTLYVDTSALLKRYVDEPESAQCERYLLGDPDWLTARVTLVEIRRNLARLLASRSLSLARRAFERDWRRMDVVELDEVTCRTAAEIAELTGVRSLDALHLGAASRLGRDTITFLAYDARLAQAARELGFRVLGA